jgi:hypothetical protein
MFTLNLACIQEELISNKDFHIVRAINIIFVNKNYLVNSISNPIMKKKIEKVIKNLLNLFLKREFWLANCSTYLEVVYGCDKCQHEEDEIDVFINDDYDHNFDGVNHRMDDY